MPRGKKILVSIFTLSIIIFNFSASQAEEPISLDLKVLRFDKATIVKGYTAKVFNKNFSLAVLPNVLSAETEIIFKDFYQPKNITNIPENLQIISHLYEFNIINKAAYDSTKPLIIEINYPEDRNNYKKIYYWEESRSEWLPLPTQTMPYYGRLKAKINMPAGRLAVFEDNSVLAEGTASWYRYRDCDCAASPDYPKGAKLKVTNLDNNKEVVVTVNDYGPDRTLHPDRVLDLDIIAFKKIAKKGAGLIKVKIEPVNNLAVIVAGNQSQATSTLITLIPNVNQPQIDFEIFSSAVIIVNAKTNEVIWTKNENQVMPVASLTKLMAAEIFLQHNPGWEKVMSYNDSDNDVLNYAKRWEMGYLNVSKGETLTVKDLFYTGLVGSANNAIYTLARSTGLLRRDFVNLMNYQAALWGMGNTRFTEPSGLDQANISTASDLAKLGLQVFKKLDFLKSTTLKQYSFSTLNTKKPHFIRNYNQILKSDLYVLGSKTGYLDEAGHCLIAKVKDKVDQDKELIIVVLGAKEKKQSVEDTINLAKWGLEKLKVKS